MDTNHKMIIELLDDVSKAYGVTAEAIVGSRRNDALLAARREFFVTATQDLGISGYSLAAHIGWTAAAIYYHVNQWKKAQQSTKRKKAA